MALDDADRPRMPAACSVRRAAAQDVAASVALLIASITSLCVEDHANDPATLARWLSNKTVPSFEQWLADPENVIVIAELGSVLCGVGLLHSSGAIRLCYVLPGKQHQGVGRALIQRLEAEATRRGVVQLVLTSTVGARRFYAGLGFAPNGPARTGIGVLTQYPYVKPLPRVAVERDVEVED